MKFGQLTEYNIRNIFFEKSYTKGCVETIPRPLFSYFGILTGSYSFTRTFSSNNNTWGIVSKMNEHKLLILINTNFMINY